MYTNPNYYPYVKYSRKRWKQPLEPSTEEYVLPSDHPASRGLHRNPGPIPGLFHGRPNPLDPAGKEKDPLLRYERFATARNLFRPDHPDTSCYIPPDPNVIQHEYLFSQGDLLLFPLFLLTSSLSLGFVAPLVAPALRESEGFYQTAPPLSSPKHFQDFPQASEGLNQSQKAFVIWGSSDTHHAYPTRDSNDFYDPGPGRREQQKSSLIHNPRLHVKRGPSKLSQELILSPGEPSRPQKRLRPLPVSQALDPSVLNEQFSLPVISNFGEHIVQEDSFPKKRDDYQDLQDSLSPSISNALKKPNIGEELINADFLPPSQSEPISNTGTILATSSPQDVSPMPFNNSAIPPTEETTGTATLPCMFAARIIHLDPDILQWHESRRSLL